MEVIRYLLLVIRKIEPEDLSVKVQRKRSSGCLFKNKFGWNIQPSRLRADLTIDQNDPSKNVVAGFIPA